MRRPLFWVALFLVVIAAVRLETGGFDHLPPGVISVQSLGVCEELTITGQVYKKDDQTIYLQDISVHLLISENLLSETVSQAGFSRQSISCKDNIICKLSEADGILLGSYVALAGSFAPFSPATNPGEFDAAAYYQTIGVGGRLSRAELLGRGQDYWPVREWLYELRLELEERLHRGLPEGQAGILCALLLGEKGGLEEQVEELYRRNGILHILSISSLHITILGMSLYKLLRRLRVPTGLSALAGCVLLLLYGSMTGFGVSACRAIGMYLIRMLGEALGRTYDMLTALGVAAAVMVLGNPRYLYHSGFLLSFSSVLGIGVLCPALMGDRKRGGEQPAGWERLWGSLRQSAVASVSVVLATLPVQLWCYYEVPVYAVFLNLLVLPLVKPLMLLGILLLMLPGLLPAGFGVGLILRWYEFLCGCFSRLPFHTWNPGCPKLWQIVVYYLLLTAAVTVKRQLEQRRRPAGAAPGQQVSKRNFRRLRTAIPWVGAACAVLVLGLRSPAENQAVFLDVGQGDCILVRTASGENYLFDCGSTSRSGVGEYVLVPCLKYYGIRRLDAVFVSHPDEDHVNGILELFEMGEESGVEVGQLVLPEIAEELRGEQLGQLMTGAGAAGQSNPVEIRYLAAGDSWQVGSANFLCLHPESNSTLEDSNVYSECVYVEFWENSKNSEQPQHKVAMLLTGDVEGQGEKTLLKELAERGIRSVDVLKVAHHGSRGTTSKELLEQINPVIAVISSGRNNRYGHPHAELLERLEDCGCLIYRTQESGAVTVRVKDGKVSVEEFCRGKF